MQLHPVFRNPPPNRQPSFQTQASPKTSTDPGGRGWARSDPARPPWQRSLATGHGEAQDGDGHTRPLPGRRFPFLFSQKTVQRPMYVSPHFSVRAFHSTGSFSRPADLVGFKSRNPAFFVFWWPNYFTYYRLVIDWAPDFIADIWSRKGVRIFHGRFLLVLCLAGFSPKLECPPALQLKVSPCSFCPHAMFVVRTIRGPLVTQINSDRAVWGGFLVLNRTHNSLLFPRTPTESPHISPSPIFSNRHSPLPRDCGWIP